MSVLIKDMEMPKNCAECERWSICKCLNDYEDYESILYAVEDGDLVKADGCPLVGIPTPHGELVDRNGLMDIYADRLTAVAERYSPDSSECGILSGAMKLLAIMPTLIEAED